MGESEVCNDDEPLVVRETPPNYLERSNDPTAPPPWSSSWGGLPAYRTLATAVTAFFAFPLIFYTVDAITSSRMASHTVTASTGLHETAVTFHFPCGSSPDEARRLGCHFDVMSFSWLPPQCFDRELVDDFLARKQWSYYQIPISHNVENEVPMANVSTGEIDHLFVTWEFHQVHCAYMVRKLHRALSSKRPLDGYIDNLAHTEHCTEVMMDRETDLNYIWTKIFVKYPSCGKEISRSHRWPPWSKAAITT